MIAGAFVLLVVAGFGLQTYSATKNLMAPATADLRMLGLALKQLTPPGSFIITADYGIPTALYYAERKGWHFTENNAIYNGHPASSAAAISDLEHLRKEGATHIAFYSGTVWWLDYYEQFTRHLVETSDHVEKTSAYQVFMLRPWAQTGFDNQSKSGSVVLSSPQEKCDSHPLPLQ